MNPTITHQAFNDCETCAYHEAGHVLFAYLCGYRCMEVQLINENNDEGFSSYVIIDYGKDEEYAARLNAAQDLDFFRCLSLGQQMESIEVGRKLARIYLGGSVAAAVFRNGGNIHIPLPMQIEFTDLQHATFIHEVIRQTNTDQEDQFIEHGLQEALYTLSNINIWNTVADLAERLLQARVLSRNDMEECLEAHGISFSGEQPIDVFPGAA